MSQLPLHLDSTTVKSRDGGQKRRRRRRVAIRIRSSMFDSLRSLCFVFFVWFWGRRGEER